MDPLAADTALRVVWALIGLLSCYGIVWFFRHARRWAEEPLTDGSEAMAETGAMDAAAGAAPPRLSGPSSSPLQGPEVFVFFAVWLCVQWGFVGLFYESLKMPRHEVSLTSDFGLLLPDVSPPVLLICVGLVGQLLTLALIAPFAATVRGLPRELGLDRLPSLRHCLALAFLWLVSLVPIFTVEQLWVTFLEWVGHRPYRQPALEEYSAAVSAGDLFMVVSVVVSAVAAAPVLEELLFRGLLHNFLSRWAGRVAGTILSAAWFSVVHLVPSVLLPLFVLGCLLSAIFEWRRSVWDCIVFHAIFNLGSLVLALVMTYWSN